MPSAPCAPTAQGASVSHTPQQPSMACNDEVAFLRRTVEELSRRGTMDTQTNSSTCTPGILNQPQHSLSSFYKKVRQDDTSPSGNPNLINNTFETMTTYTEVPASGFNGKAADQLPHIELVSPTLRQAILSGKDINLALLLLPDADVGEMKSMSILTCSIDPLTGTPIKTKKDPRLHKMLSITEFYEAFAIFKNVMCEAFPQRRKELDGYLRIIIELSSQFGGFIFYAYHKAFSAKCATWLTQYGEKVDWSIKDTGVLQAVTAGIKMKACDICSAHDHNAKFCPLSNEKQSNARPNNSSGSSQSQSQNDKRGRKRLFQAGKELCNNFNSAKGCHWEGCPRSHLCSSCKGTHSASTCKKQYRPNQVKDKTKTEAKVDH